MQRSEQPTAAAFLNLTLESKTQLRARYSGVPIFSSCEEMLANAEVMDKIDGVIICTAHACHAEMGMKFLAAGKHVLMEKPMTVDVPEARELAAAADRALRERQLAFMVRGAARAVEKGSCACALSLVRSALRSTTRRIFGPSASMLAGSSRVVSWAAYTTYSRSCTRP